MTGERNNNFSLPFSSYPQPHHVLVQTLYSIPIALSLTLQTTNKKHTKKPPAIQARTIPFVR